MPRSFVRSTTATINTAMSAGFVLMAVGEVARTAALELAVLEPNTACESLRLGFNKDFVPISPLRIHIQRLGFYITPLEDPHYAFAENAVQQQPMVTVIMEVGPSPDYASAVDFYPVTFVKTVTAGVQRPIPAPIKAVN